MENSIVILGSGYTGAELARLLTGMNRPFIGTSRKPQQHLAHIREDRRVCFDLSQRETWANIPSGTDLLWCFPAIPLDLVQRFAATLKAPPRRLVVLGSTSAYDVSKDSNAYPPPWINESTPIDLTKPRVQGEEYLRKEHGAIVLRVAGIYGPGRNPLDWIKSGRVSPSRKYVNLIHVEDLAAICLLALEKGKPGEVYNVSDGTPRTWEWLSAAAQERWGTTLQNKLNEDQPGKRIASTRLREEIGYQFRHADLLVALAQLSHPTRID